MWAGAAERPAPKADSDNAPPQLVSRTGGGPRWTSIADVKRDAGKGVPAACFELAGCYESGRDVPKDIAKALALYQQAATGGEANGWFRLGKIYADGLGVESDLPKAFLHQIASPTLALESHPVSRDNLPLAQPTRPKLLIPPLPPPAPIKISPPPLAPLPPPQP